MTTFSTNFSNPELTLITIYAGTKYALVLFYSERQIELKCVGPSTIDKYTEGT